MRASFEQSRNETVRYHEEFYARACLGQSGTWLAKPHRLLDEALALLPADRPAVAYDLGAGVGRHTIPMINRLPARSTVYAIDLLPSALRTLRGSIPAGSASMVRTRAVDLDAYEFETDADLVLAFSAVEHLPDTTAIARLFDRIHAAMNPGGIVAVGVVADRQEIPSDGAPRPALLESGISGDESERLLAHAFGEYEVVSTRRSPAQVSEERAGESYLLTSTLVTWLGTRP